MNTISKIIPTLSVIGGVALTMMIAVFAGANS